MRIVKFVSHRGMGQVCDTAGLLFDVNLCVPVHSMALKLCYLGNVSVTKVLRSNNVVEFSCPCPVPGRVGLGFVYLLYDGSTQRLTKSGLMEKPGTEPATPGLQGVDLSPAPRPLLKTFCGFSG